MAQLPAVFVLAVLASIALPGPAESLRILGLFPVPAPSHYVMFKVLMEGLVERGHEVVSFSPFRNAQRHANWTDVDTAKGSPSIEGTITFDMLKTAEIVPGAKMHGTISTIARMAGSGMCRHVFQQDEFGALMQGRYGRFDLVLTEIFGSDCWAAVAYKMGVPLIGISSAPDVSWMHDRLGSPDNPSYIANVLGNLAGRLSLWQRLVNTATTLYANHLFTTLVQHGADDVVREFIGDGVPPVQELVKNTSLVLLNRHVSIHTARPVVPNLVHVGGLHIKAPPGKLAAALRAWMDGAEHGVIFFSLGSLVRAASLPAALRDTFLAAFAKLPQRVLWKYEDEGLALPPNVRVSKWLPQMDVLTHPKTVLFITHGGLMGTLESLHSGVPMLGIPLFADQMLNIEQYMSLGIADRLDLATLSEESALAKIRGMTENPSYQRRAREVANLFVDRPRRALDEAVWWLEYVARHRGARHLRSPAVDMPLHEYLLLDVMALVVAMVGVTVAAGLWILSVLGHGQSASAPASRAHKQKTS